MRMLRWFPVPMLLGMLFAHFVAIAQTSGPSVNMVSGTGWTNGDPFVQRQNEPSLAVSTRNTQQVCLALLGFSVLVKD
jgi:hypothetical protein